MAGTLMCDAVRMPELRLSAERSSASTPERSRHLRRLIAAMPELPAAHWDSPISPPQPGE
jgi:hypothetical protein